ncbi:MAG: preprotein translocase subunit SecG [bacterium]
MHQFLLVIHIFACIVLVIAILVFQTGKGSAMSMFGGGGGDTLFSARWGTDFIKKFTIGAAITFAMTSLLLTMITARRNMRSVVQEYPLQQGQPQQAAPAQPAAGAESKAAPAASAAQSPAPAENKKK